MMENDALVGRFHKNAAPGEVMMYEPVAARDKHMFFDAPYLPDEYEVRAHINGVALNESTLVAKAPIIVQEQPQKDTQ
jgi:hypothetical protein